MQFKQTFDFECSAATLMRMFGDDAYYREKYRRMATPQPEFIGMQGEGDEFSVSMRHELDTAAFKLPALARKHLGAHVTLLQTDCWNLAAGTGHIDIATDDLPVTAALDMYIAEQENGTQLILAFDVRAQLPVFAGKVEKAVADGLVQRMREELVQTAQMAPAYAE